ncbi:DUF1772 domain-containing protein [Kibdelosporangium phytohabitans]|uniref:Monooxygenase n=1 Tax=Kibdelosporangium phytohabitans TaxID=860235 RepID=A0A0N9I815_9PSEU|nr:DUF1772 domain-containing protein [Kibdelosporangium phytohabitans]ALG10912.1 hypothetical protein AOZ06_32095 [Kibdelosporangium phytohabitans]MBE1462103.1 putative membrane protein [Kibdelosporangium phytohabitans]
MLTVLVPLVLLCNGLAAGVLVGTLLGGWPLMDTLSAPQYVHAHAFFSTRYDPFMPVCLMTTIVADVVLSLFADPVASRALFASAALATLSTVVISFTKNVPVNRWIRTVDPDSLPADFAERDPRRHWGKWNRARAGLTVVALVANCGALAALL